MKEDIFRGFHHLSQAWYYYPTVAGSDIRDELTIGLYAQSGGTAGEFVIRWVELGGAVVARLEAYYDAWEALMQFDDLLRWLAGEGKWASPLTVAAKLKELGVKDLTNRTLKR